MMQRPSILRKRTSKSNKNVLPSPPPKKQRFEILARTPIYSLAIPWAYEVEMRFGRLNRSNSLFPIEVHERIADFMMAPLLKLRKQLMQHLELATICIREVLNRAAKDRYYWRIRYPDGYIPSHDDTKEYGPKHNLVWISHHTRREPCPEPYSYLDYTIKRWVLRSINGYIAHAKGQNVLKWDRDYPYGAYKSYHVEGVLKATYCDYIWKERYESQKDHILYELEITDDEFDDESEEEEQMDYEVGPTPPFEDNDPNDSDYDESSDDGMCNGDSQCNGRCLSLYRPVAKRTAVKSSRPPPRR